MKDLIVSVVRPLLANKTTQTALYVAMGCCLALFVNIFISVPIYGHLSLNFAQAIAVIFLLKFGLRAAFPISFCAALGLYWVSGAPYFIITLCFEILVYAYLLKRGWSIIAAALIFWITLGVPLSFLITTYAADFSLEYTILTSIKQMLNGVMYVLIAYLVVLLIPGNLRRKDKPLLKHQLYDLFNVSILLPSLIVALVIASNDARQQTHLISLQLRDDASLLSRLLNDKILKNQNVIKSLAFDANDAAHAQEMLDNAVGIFTDFKSMLITDAEGHVIAGAPSQLLANMQALPKAQRRVSDRTYFAIPKQTNQHYISSAFMGRGFGSDAIVALSSPYYENGEFAGVVEGSLEISSFDTIEDTYSHQKDNAIIIVDNEDKVVFTSKQLNLEQLSLFTPEFLDNHYFAGTKLLKINDKVFLFSEAATEFSWKAYVLVSPLTMTNTFLSNIILLIATIALISSVFLFVSRRFSAQITQPMSLLAKRFRLGHPSSNLEYNFLEIQEIGKTLNDAKNIMDSFNQELESRVEQQTRELKIANEKLTVLSNQDGMTKLANRRFFNSHVEKLINICCRNQQSFSIAVFDIDDFKAINDKYGHLGGDTCLIEIAKLLKTFFNRASDCVARLGGDELVIFTSSNSIEQQLQRFKKFHQAVANHIIPAEGNGFSVTISMGIVSANSPEPRDCELRPRLIEADRQLYKSKHAGKNQYRHIVL